MKWRIQFARYVVVGVISNAVGYLLYLVLTAAGMEHKAAMTLLYAIGLAQTFVFNRRWSFEHRGEGGRALLRYLAAYGFGYVVNLAALVLFVDRLGLPHQWVQAGMVVVLAGMLFLLQRYWVFRPAEWAAERSSTLGRGGK